VEYAGRNERNHTARILNARRMCVTTHGQQRPAGETGNALLP
jgi:hypothetical protein